MFGFGFVMGLYITNCNNYVNANSKILWMRAAMHVLIRVGMYNIQSLKWGGAHICLPPTPLGPMQKKSDVIYV